MKKYLSMILVVAIAAVLSISAFAAPALPGDHYVDVKLGLTGEVINVYSVDIEYTGEMIFTYSNSGMEWTVGENGYSYNMEKTGWTDADQTLTIFNHSDLKLGYTVTLAKASKYDELTFELNGGDTASGTLPACTVGTAYRSVKTTIPVVVSGTIPHDAASGDKLGVLTVTFNAVP